MTPDALYHEALLRLARGAGSAARLGAPDATARRDNPLCGDDVTVDVRVRGGRVAEVGHHVRGCVLCQAATAVLRAGAPGCTRDELSRVRAAVAAMLREDGAVPPGRWEGLAAFLPVRAVPSRHPCVLLPFDTLADALARAPVPWYAGAEGRPCMPDEARLSRTVATAILGIDTLWGGDVMSPSGAGRYIADSWFSDEPLPEAYTHPAAARLRETGGVAARSPDAAAVDAYLAAVDVPGAIDEAIAQGRALGGLRGAFLEGQGESLRVMWALAEELRGRGPRVPYERCVIASTGSPPEPSRPDAKREQLAALLGAPPEPERLLAAVDAWRGQRLVPRAAIPLLADAFIARLEEGTRRHVVPHLPAALHAVPRANIEFQPIENAWFSGSMNYLGRARDAGGAPRYEATYEINAALQISVPEFVDLVAHEVIPGHVTNFALAQALYVQGKLGFEGTVLTMNTRGAALSEGLANSALLLAFGVNEVAELPDRDLQIGKLLGLLQDDAKNQASWSTWEEGRPQDEVARVLRSAYLCSEERAAKISGAWARHPLNGRMYLPCYRAGMEKVAELRRRHPPGKVIPALYQVLGLVDVVTIDRVIEPPPGGASAR